MHIDVSVPYIARPALNEISQPQAKADALLLSWAAQGPASAEHSAAENIIAALLKYKFVKQDINSSRKRERLISEIEHACRGIDHVPHNFGEMVADYLSGPAFKNGKSAAAQAFLSNPHIDRIVRRHLATSQCDAMAVNGKTETRHAREIARKIKAAFRIDYSNEIKQRELSTRFRSLAPRIELMSKTAGISGTRKAVLQQMAASLANFEISAQRIDFAQEFNRQRWALPEALQIEISQMVGDLKDLAPIHEGIIGHRATENVHSLTALWDAAWLGLAKFKMKAICATYGSYLDMRISRYQGKLNRLTTASSEHKDYAREINEYKSKIDGYIKKYNQYSYFNYGIGKYAKLERQINQLAIQIPQLTLKDEKKKNLLLANLQALQGKLSRLNARSQYGVASAPIAYTQDLIRFVKDNPATITETAIFNIGHAGNVIAVPGQDNKPIVIITDPMLDDAHKAYPAETQIPIMSDGELYVPRADYIFISHNHMDHVHPHSIKMLIEKNPAAHIIVPAGCTEEFVQYGVSADRIIAACQWGMSIPLDSATTLQITPAVHWSGSPRENAGINMSGVMSCIISSFSSKQDVFYAGDTANFPSTMQQEIDNTFNGEHSKIFLLPSGPNYPNKHMKSTHQNTAAQSYFGLPLNAGASEMRLEHLSEALDINAFIDQAAAQAPLALPFRTVLTHHNQIHFGEDRYNETLYIHCKQMILLKDHLPPTQLREMAKRDRRNSFIYTETAILLERMQQLYNASGLATENIYLATANHLLNHIQSPAIGGQMLTGSADICATNVAALKKNMNQAAYEFSPRASTR
ncbi:MBL fold metallo-hydrolase [Duganella qianjiadongensis]|uniref:Metallo-beta-lactamase domain-containing protein n=1 Tax=Duganella qianjiadongensis TaxID=2692176 RepID=A0ABW9VP95_9BURK|nr:MBL fold metallo-hydrolase [Duganella qianjiadongensis]MYM41352.1 hypothetical protein [Duganella qianjiadongensis]